MGVAFFFGETNLWLNAASHNSGNVVQWNNFSTKYSSSCKSIRYLPKSHLLLSGHIIDQILPVISSPLYEHGRSFRKTPLLRDREGIFAFASWNKASRLASVSILNILHAIKNIILSGITAGVERRE
jgi:hypothetical protein